jgi:hypothetical protein
MGVKFFVLLALAGLLLSACGDEAAIDQARARRIEQQTADDAAKRADEREREMADWKATRPASNAAEMVFIIVVSVSIALSVAAALAVLVLRWYQASRAVIVYAEQRAALLAGMVRVSPTTLTWPTLVNGGAVHNLETGEVYRLGEPRAADPQQVTGDVLIRALGVGARGAAQIAKCAKNAQPADAIPTLAGAMPLVLRPIEAGESRRNGAKGGQDDQASDHLRACIV